MKLTYIIYRSPRFIGRQKWRWKTVAPNGRKIANGGEAFTNRADCEASVNLIRAAGATDSVVEVRR